jgi:hypothetical protein
MLSPFDVALLVVSLAGYVFLFLKLRQAEARSVEQRDRVERTLAAVERLAAVPAAAPFVDELGGRALSTAEDARDQISAARADVAELAAHQRRGFSMLDARIAAAAEAVDAARGELAAAVEALREASSAKAVEAPVVPAANADADAELARKRLRMFP